MPKRTKIWSNSALIRRFDVGRLKKKPGKKANSGVHKYRDKKGNRKVTGSPLLKRSQQLVSIPVIFSIIVMCIVYIHIINVYVYIYIHIIDTTCMHTCPCEYIIYAHDA